jgi:hypothetical protein
MLVYCNVYESSTGAKYVQSTLASGYYQNAGTHNFSTAPSGTADAAATLTDRMTISNAGNVSIGQSPAPSNVQLKIRTSNQSTSNYAFGIDNSVADLFYVRNDGMIIKPLQPSFYVTSTAGSTTYASNEVIVFNTARHNTGSCYNLSNGRFTAPIGGKYLFIFNTYAYGGYTTQIILSINGSAYTVSDTTPLFFYAGSTSQAFGFTLIWELAASDYVEIRIRPSGIAQIYRAHSYFSGQLLS